jgi:multidrug efflux pump subunit AcrA (membrane-fusion protein)
METERPEPNQPADAGANRKPATDGKAKRPRWLNWRTGLVLIIVAVILSVACFWKGTSPAAANPDALTTVAVAKVDREDLFTQLTRDAEFRPYVEVELHAKISGYVDQINVDFGDKVKAGQLLATIEVPELLD